jgi:hypothetical protein
MPSATTSSPSSDTSSSTLDSSSNAELPARADRG